MITELAKHGNLRNFLAEKFNELLWDVKLIHLYNIFRCIYNLHELGYCHKDLHSGKW